MFDEIEAAALHKEHDTCVTQTSPERLHQYAAAPSMSWRAPIQYLFRAVGPSQFGAWITIIVSLATRRTSVDLSESAG